MTSAKTGLHWSHLVNAAGLAPGWRGGDDPLITSVAEDSRQVSPGAVFVALRGTLSDGHTYVPAALNAGAVAVVAERDIDVPAGVPLIKVASARGVAGRLAAIVYGLEKRLRSGDFRVIGITGTNGKSTFCYLTRGIFQEVGEPAAMLGTVEYDLIARRMEATMTTPPAATLVSYLAEAADAGATRAVMEVSSHALDQGRVDGIRFSVGVFSNLTGDHLDYHKDMESYLLAKKRLFDGLGADAFAVINGDDPAGDRMVASCRAKVLRFGILGTGGRREPEAQVAARIQAMDANGTRFHLIVDAPAADLARDAAEVNLPLVGRHNVQNALASAAACLAMGVPLPVVAKGLEQTRVVPGRLERVDLAPIGETDPGFTVLVDYAHTHDALTNVLSALRPLTSGRLIVMFGCGGDRDRTKRPKMAAAVAAYADLAVVTSDNPRTEDPQAIIDEVLTGFPAGSSSRVRVEPDRRKAIGQCLATAGAGDVVLLAGKGHETYQEIGRERLPFSDVAMAKELWRQART